MSISRRVAWLIWLCAAFALLLSRPSAAFTLTVNDREFESWGLFCKVSYLASNADKKFAHTGKVSRADRNRIGDVREGYGGPWHYCAGIIALQRAMYAGDIQKRKHWAKRANSEAGFTYRRLEPGHWIREDAGVVIGRANMLLGDYKTASQVLFEVIKEFPRSEKGHLALYFLYRQGGAIEKAQDILERGNQALDGRSAQIHYFLGLAYVDQGKLERAEKHAERAYALGYPLPGLKDRLDAAKTERKAERKTKRTEGTRTKAIEETSDSAAGDSRKL